MTRQDLFEEERGRFCAEFVARRSFEDLIRVFLGEEVTETLSGERYSIEQALYIHLEDLQGHNEIYSIRYHQLGDRGQRTRYSNLPRLQ
jgi:hypothetical protein